MNKTFKRILAESINLDNFNYPLLFPQPVLLDKDQHFGILRARNCQILTDQILIFDILLTNLNLFLPWDEYRMFDKTDFVKDIKW